MNVFNSEPFSNGQAVFTLEWYLTLIELHTLRCFLWFDIKTFNVNDISTASKHILHCTVIFEPFF